MALQDRSSLTWAVIGAAPRRGLGSEKISQSSLRVPIPASVPVDKRDKIVSFRFGGGVERFLGYRDVRVFYVVWIDPHGKAYDHD